MFKPRTKPKAVRRAVEDDDQDQEVSDRLRELKDIQSEIWRKNKGVPPVPEQMKRETEEDKEEEEEKWGLDAGFSGGATTKRESDPHLEAFLNERLNLRKEEEDRAKEKTREDRLFEIPDGLQVPDRSMNDADKMSWITGLAEVPLSIEHKLANIEATEKAKREFLYGGGGNVRKGRAVLEPDEVTRKAFGTRFSHHKDPSANSKGPTDDAALERHRKRMRN